MLKRLFIALVAVVLVVFGWYFQAIRPVTNVQMPPQEFEIKTGQGIDKIIDSLSQQKLIRSRTAFKITVVRLGISSKIQAGFFQISPSMNANDIALKLTKASVKEVRVTLQEGIRVQEIAFIIDKAFKSQNPQTSFNATTFVSKTKSMEGQLFPDTYAFDPKADTDTVINKLHDRFIEVTGDLKIPPEKLASTVILASLLEREAASAAEMPSVAGVLTNRLKIGMALGVDATVQYAIATSRCKNIDCDWWPKNLSKSDIQFKSPYNTYLNPGLPIAPISNPGKDSLLAASNPGSNDYFYYLHDSSGQIHFAKTLQEHDQNICKYLKKSCQ